MQMKANYEKITGAEEWQSIGSQYGTLFCKKLSDNMYFLNGNFSGNTAIFTIQLPFTVKKQQLFVMCGSGLNYNKAFINPSTSEIGIAVGTGDTRTVYNLNGLVITN